ncbi:hypothetical protein CERZMDRAFT_106339 [Cercospora zeae-maydis SCOH1-5]|uniref:Uncharacterized protein n=1 Tax=Cercospora zeae-maydis SCOH1-5 TaxID=717836 RepID=A0A6A6FE73_9PEZI|nr:hypothetical protein CERZMDRAFT_106339 [Cercospora zeae-maydis SCOH1-5]
MALPNDTPFDVTPTYVIYRDLQPGEPFDPTSALLFFPPKGSDELFDALRLAFPRLKTHAERMRDAIIHFLLEERQEEQLRASPAMTMDTAETWPSVSSSASASAFSSPDLLDLPTPTSFANSPQAHAPQLSRQPSAATGTKTAPPSLEQMTGVFSLSAEAQPKQRVRRKMTDAEKAEYRKRRIVKACDKCAKRKRKCPHNQSQMEDISTANSSAKIAKPVAQKSSKAPQHTSDKCNAASLDHFAPAESFDLATDLDMSTFQTFDDFPMFDDSFTPEFTVDDLLHFDQLGSNFPPHDDFSPVPSLSEHRSSAGVVYDDFTYPQPQNQPQCVTCATGDPGKSAELSHQQNSTHRSSTSGARQQSRRLSMRVSHGAEEAQTSVLLEIAQNHNGIPQQDEDRAANHNIEGSGTMRERVRSDQQDTRPTHTSHVHKTGSGELSGLADTNGVLQEPRSIPPTRSQTTPRLTGTTRALRAFTDLADPQGGPQSQRRAVSMEHAAIVLNNVNEHQLGVGGVDDSLQSAASSPHTNRHALSKHREDLQQRPPSRTAAPGLRLQTSTSVSQSGGIRIGTTALPNGRPHASSQGRDNASLSSPNKELDKSQPPMLHLSTTSRTTVVANTGNAALQGSTQPSLGQEIASLGSISTELYMLRRRPRKSGTNQNHRHTTTAVNHENASLAAQANGGAYPRLQPRDSHAAANNSGRTPSIAATPVSIVGTANVSPTASTEIPSAGPHMYYRGHHGRTDLYGRAAETKTPQEDRLRDYFKVKDHLGRPSFTITATILLVGIYLAIAILSAAGVFFSSTLACFAAFTFFSLAPEKIDSAAENTSWLSSVMRRMISPRCREESNDAAHPFALSPLRFAILV